MTQKIRRQRFSSTILLAIMGIVCLCLYREFRHEQTNHHLLDAIRDHSIARARAALDAGADPDIREPSSHSVTLLEWLRSLFPGGAAQGAVPRPARGSAALPPTA